MLRFLRRLCLALLARAVAALPNRAAAHAEVLGGLQLACAVTLIVIGIVNSNVAIVFIGVASAILSVLDKWSRYRKK